MASLDFREHSKQALDASYSKTDREFLVGKIVAFIGGYPARTCNRTSADGSRHPQSCQPASEARPACSATSKSLSPESRKQPAALSRILPCPHARGPIRPHSNRSATIFSIALSAFKTLLPFGVVHQIFPEQLSQFHGARSVLDGYRIDGFKVFVKICYLPDQ